jgi:hypothetical protein
VATNTRVAGERLSKSGRAGVDQLIEQFGRNVRRQADGGAVGAEDFGRPGRCAEHGLDGDLAEGGRSGCGSIILGGRMFAKPFREGGKADPVALGESALSKMAFPEAPHPLGAFSGRGARTRTRRSVAHATISTHPPRNAPEVLRLTLTLQFCPRTWRDAYVPSKNKILSGIAMFIREQKVTARNLASLPATPIAPRNTAR